MSCADAAHCEDKDYGCGSGEYYYTVSLKAIIFLTKDKGPTPTACIKGCLSTQSVRRGIYPNTAQIFEQYESNYHTATRKNSVSIGWPAERYYHSAAAFRKGKRTTQESQTELAESVLGSQDKIPQKYN